MNDEQELVIPDGVAIIGMSGRFPGAPDVDVFWENLLDGKESITFFSEEELSPFIALQEKNDPRYVPARGILDNVDLFDAEFFGITPMEARIMDPQQRIFLQLCWQALENAGYDPEQYPGMIGIFGGMNNNSYYLNNVLPQTDEVQKIGSFQAMLANEKDFLTTRVSYKLNLTGPSENIYTACSTGLVTVVRAFQALMTYQCDMALAGGISITVPQNSGYLYQEGGMLSPDGHCRPFDINAQGTTFNNGAGLVVLKRYDEALEDHDNIIAVIRGTGLNNDGGNKVSFTAPGVNGQRDAIRLALGQADVPPETIFYVETHGTATPQGDPIEVNALNLAFDIPIEKGKTCFLGSLKSNVGHMIHAAGVAGLIKTALAVQHGVIPPTLFYTEPNNNIDWDRNPFQVCSERVKWPQERSPRRAGVSAFGVGGTNAHVILEEAVVPEKEESRQPAHLLLLTARTESELVRQKENIRDHLTKTDQSLADAAFTLQNGRKHFNHRWFCVSGTREEAVQNLNDSLISSVNCNYTSRRDPDIVFMFPGQGTQHIGMAAGLYRQEKVFRENIDKGACILQPQLQLDIRDFIFSKTETDNDKLGRTEIAQPALFLLEYALARLWASLGVLPAAMIGHSIGELTAACIAGVFSFEDGLRLVGKRGKYMQQCPAGAMLSIRLALEEVEKLLPQDIVPATINAPQLCVVSGPSASITSLSEVFESQDIPCRILRTSHAFHSESMQPAAEKFADFLEEIDLSPPKIPFISCVTGTWITDAQAVSSHYWGQQIRQPVQFSKGMQTILDSEGVLLEVGPRRTISTLARQHFDGHSVSVISTLGRKTSFIEDYCSYLHACGQLWLTGMQIQWQELSADEVRYRVPLPTYPFTEKRFWLEPNIDENAMSGRCDPFVPQKENLYQNIQCGGNVKPIQTPANRDTFDLKKAIIEKLAEIILESSGIEIDSQTPDYTFLETGLDSLFLTQLATTVSNECHVSITFRQLLEELSSPARLADYIAENIDSSTVSEMLGVQPEAGAAPSVINDNAVDSSVGPEVLPGEVDSLQGILRQQLEIMTRQLEIITGKQFSRLPVKPVADRKDTSTPLPLSQKNIPAVDSTSQEKKSFGPAAKISTNDDAALDLEQQHYLQELIDQYTTRTRRSKEFTAKNRQHLADPRAVSGFRPIFKEMIYPIVVSRSSGSRLWDIDGNEYVDMLNGFGSNFFGYAPEFVTKAVQKQMERGFEIGPQHPLASEVVELMAEMTKLDRFAFCNTGSEAVLGTMRIARTVTGRKTIVIFAGAYHGIFDEVIVRGTPALKTFPAAPGIMSEAVKNVLILEYGSSEALKIIKERSGELAAVLVEPVQSRNPALQPREFLHEVRKITASSGTALIIDEVITGFRIDPGGAQAYFGVKADLATYGKVIGGGLPIGIIGGISRFMDALDGGQWQYGDDSFPEVGVTYFAGTFVRHPMALASCRAVLHHLKDRGRELQKSINNKAETFCRRLNGFFRSSGAPMKISGFGSLMKVEFTNSNPLNELFYFYMRNRGVHIWDGRPIFLTTAHTDEDISLVLEAFKQSVYAMQKADFFPKDSCVFDENNGDGGKSPVAGARLGKKPDGTPAWFIPDPVRPGKYVEVESEG